MVMPASPAHRTETDEANSAEHIRRLLATLAHDHRIWLHGWYVRDALAPTLAQIAARRLLPRVRAEVEAVRARGTPHTGAI
jgi:hypothetical protein